MICAIAVNVVTLPHNLDDMTTPSHTLHAVRRHPQRAATVAVLLLTLWQLPGVVFGLDLCDTGFYLTFYDHIFSAPASPRRLPMSTNGFILKDCQISSMLRIDSTPLLSP